MRLVKERKYVEVCIDSDDAYEYEDTIRYHFNNIDDVLKFLNGECVIDTIGQERWISYHECIHTVTEKVEYEVDYKDKYGDERDWKWELDDFE